MMIDYGEGFDADRAELGVLEYEAALGGRETCDAGAGEGHVLRAGGRVVYDRERGRMRADRAR